MNILKSWNQSSAILLFVNSVWACLNDEVALDDLEVATQSSVNVIGFSQTYNLVNASKRERAEKAG